MHSLRRLFIGLTVIAVVAGCEQNQQSGQTSQTETPAQTAPPATTPAPDAATPAWVTQVRQGESQLVTSVEQGRLAEVHDQAVKLEAVLQQVSDQAGSLSADQRQQVTEHIAGAKQLVNELHDAADAGDLTKAKSKLEEFRTHLRAIEGVFGVAAP